MERIFISPDEKIVLKLRKHWIMLARDVIGTVVVAAVPFIVLPIVKASGALPFSIDVPTPLITYVGALWLLVVWLAIAVLATNYYLDLWIVTTKSVLSLDQVGLFNRRVTTWRMEHIQEISVLIENPIQALFNYGTLEIETAGPSDEHAHISGVPHPEKIRTAILRQVSEFKSLEERNKQQETLLHTISHEVKGYLTKDAAALSSIADGDLGTVPDTVKSVADTALSSARRGVDTVMNILDSASLKNGSMQLSCTPFDIRRAVIEIAEDIRSDAEHKNLLFDVVLGDGTYVFNGDEGKLRRMVFRNLIDNAVRYTVTGSVQISLSYTPQSILFSVKDSGVGISSDDMDKLFTEGGKGANSQAINPESTGYGLFIARQVVEAHGGKIWAESDGVGKGATFFVELPVA